MLYVGDWCDRSTITQIDLQVETIASLAGDIYSEGVNDGAALTANINRVHSMAFDKAGNIFFVDYYTHRVRFLNMTSKLISTVAGFNLTEGFENGPAGVHQMTATVVTIVSHRERVVKNCAAITPFLSQLPWLSGLSTPELHGTEPAG